MASAVLFLSVKEILEAFASAGVAELAECLCFNLADTLTGNAEFAANLFKSVGVSVLKSEAESKNLCFSGSEGFEIIVELLFEKMH